MSDPLSMTFAADTHALAAVRHFARQQASRLHWDVDLELLAVVVGELAANAAVHQTEPARLELAPRSDGGLEVSVWDPSGEHPQVVTEDAWSADGHRGMQLIDALTSSWGVERASTGKRVWAILDPINSPV